MGAARFLIVGLTLLFAACTASEPAAQPASAPEAVRPDPRLAAIEQRTGGRLGVALVDAGGRTLLQHRMDERFAMCSTFKLPLAGMVLDGVGRGRWSPGERLPLTRADILSHSPLSEPHVAAGHIPLGQATAAIVTHSDNAAANLILRRAGGPAALTAWLRTQGDPATRLDRFELALNENARGDPRDTTTPAAMANTARRLLIGDALPPASRDMLRQWTTASQTGLRRVRAGLPQSWQTGDKTGSCGTAWNDVAWIRAPSGAEYALAVYLDRPDVTAGQAEAAIAEVARLVVGLVR